MPHERALLISDDVAFFQAVRSVLVKRVSNVPKSDEELDHAVRQIVSRAVAPDGVVDIFAAAGLAKPDLSILSDEFLAEVRGMPERNLAVELLRKLLRGEIRTRRRKNVVQARSFAEMLEQAVRRYHNRAIEAAQVIEELIQLPRICGRLIAGVKTWVFRRKNWPFTTPLRPTIAPSRCWARRRYAASRGNWWGRSARTLPLIGPYGRTCGPDSW